MPEAVIVAAARSPIGRASKGSLVECRPDDLTVAIARAVLAKVPQLDPDAVQDLLLGCAEPAGESGFNLARIVAILAGMPNVPGVTVNRLCASSLQTIRMAFHNPLFAQAEERTAELAKGGVSTWEPPAGLPDVYIETGQAAENIRLLEHVSRREMDEYATLSQQRAVRSQRNGFFQREIIPIITPGGTVVNEDDGPRPGTTVEILAELKPVFRPDGEVTAGNSCPLNDGAAAVVVMSDSKARELGITPLARIVASGISAINPEIRGLGTIEASRQALSWAGMTINDIDLVEINEDFAAQVIPSARYLEIPWEKLNVNGGAIALGHPFGMTGARIMTTLLNSLQTADKTFGLETMCVAGGQGMAMVVERLS